MPFGEKPECLKCGTQETPLWHATEAGSICNCCLEKEKNDSKANVEAVEEQSNNLKPARKSTRVTKYCTATMKNVPKTKGRRHIFKRTVSFFQTKLLNFRNFF